MDKIEFKIDAKNLKNMVKSLAALQGYTFAKLKAQINEKYNKTDHSRNLIKKLDTKTIKLTEFVEVAEALNYEIILRKK